MKDIREGWDFKNTEYVSPVPSKEGIGGAKWIPTETI